MKKTRLDIAYEFDFELIGIISSFKDYKLAWNLNKALKIDLSRNEDINIKFINYELVISNFVFSSDNNELRLLKNSTLEPDQKSDRYLVPEMKHIDYFFQLSSLDDTFKMSDVLNSIKIANGVELAMQIPLDSLKSKENFIYE